MISRRRVLTGGLGLSAGLALGGCRALMASAPSAKGVAAWDFLQPGDVIDVIAPSSPVDNPQDRYAKIQAYFAKTPYKVRIPKDLIEPTVPLDEANTIEKRAQFIHEAFESESKAVWAIGGGGWGVSMLDALKAYPKPSKVKPVLGYSDVTALHVFVETQWNFPSIQSVVLGINSDISPGWNKNGLGTAMDVLTGKTPTLSYQFTPLNDKAIAMAPTTTKIVGGNSLLVAALNGTEDYTLDTKGKFVFLESIADGPGQFSRKLNGMAYSPLIRDSLGVIFGDVIETGGHANPPDQQEQFDYIIARFASVFAKDKIVLQAKNMFGHGELNLPLPFGTVSEFSSNGAVVTGKISANLV